MNLHCLQLKLALNGIKKILMVLTWIIFYNYVRPISNLPSKNRWLSMDRRFDSDLTYYLNLVKHYPGIFLPYFACLMLFAIVSLMRFKIIHFLLRSYFIQCQYLCFWAYLYKDQKEQLLSLLIWRRKWTALLLTYI